MTDYVSTHRKVIVAIHENWFDGEPFALREAAAKACVSTSSVLRTLRVLMKTKHIRYSTRGYAGRHYRVTSQWPGRVKDAIQSFEYAKVLKI